MPSVASTRKRLDALLAAADEQSRYLDLALHLRRLTADFAVPVGEDQVFTAAGVEFITLTAGQTGVLVRSAVIGQSAQVLDGAELVAEGGAPAGTLRAEVVLAAGGRWDRLGRCYAAEPARAPLVFDLVESQVQVARWFSAWLTRYRARQGDPRRRKARDIRTLLHYGNRGGGKTVLGLLLLLAVCITVPESIVWIISCSRPQSEEDIRENLRRLLPPSWYSYRGQPAYRYLFPNGSRLRELTGDSPEDLKQGRVDVALVNEGAKMDRRAYAYPIGRVSDREGILLITSNPPTADVPKGVWVKDLADKVKEAEAEGRWLPAIVFKSDNKDNAATGATAKDDVALLLHAIAPDIARADADGELVAIGERMVHAYDKIRHGMRQAPDVGDITEQFTKKRYGRAFRYLAGVDFQDSPYIIATFWRLYGTLEEPILWCVSEHTTKGSEDDFLDELELGGVSLGEGRAEELEPYTVLFIGDSSAQWQDRKHRGAQSFVYPPSFKYFKDRGLTIIPPAEKITPESRFAKNPLVGPSYGLVNRWFKTDRLFVSPLAPKLQEANKECIAKKMEKGAKAEVKYSHALDTQRYVVWWVDPPARRRGQGGKARAVGV